MESINSNFYKTKTIGIIGCGHLGQAIACALIESGFCKENLLISHRSNSVTEAKLKELNIDSCLHPNEEIFRKANMILLAVKPQDLASLHNSAVDYKGILVSCIAGVSILDLRKIFPEHLFRMMFSGPDTILSKKGIAAVYPFKSEIMDMIRFMGLQPFALKSEYEIDVFTAGVCMPAALIKTGMQGSGVFIENLKHDYPLLSEIYRWAINVLPLQGSSDEMNTYLFKMITKGGVTEAIINSLNEGDSLDNAMRKGIQKVKDIAAETGRSLQSRS